MKIGYSSIGNPGLDVEDCERLAIRFNLDFVEWRALEGTLDLPGYFQVRAVKAVRIPVRVLASSLSLIDANEHDMTAFCRFMRLAHQLGVPYVRIFGGGHHDEWPSIELLAKAVTVIGNIRRIAAAEGWRPGVLLETHGAFSDPRLCKELNEMLSEPLELLWDSHHTWRHGGERPAATWARLGPWIRHVHYKDGATRGGIFEYVLPGQGTFPTAELFGLLRSANYDGGVSLEWEKLWHPQLAPLETALESFATVARRP